METSAQRREGSMGDAAYDLRAPAAARGESITSQLQREILGDAAERRDAPPTPAASARDDAELGALATPEALAAGSAGSPRAASNERRRTLSPSKALDFFSSEGITDSVLTASRRDTVSPEAIRSMLRGLNEPGAESRRASVASALGIEMTGDSLDEDVISGLLSDVARTKQYLESSKMALEQPVDKRVSKRRRSGAGAKSKQAVEQDSFTDAFFSSTLMSRDDDDDDEDDGDDGEKATARVTKGASAPRRATLDPADIELMLSDAQEERRVVGEDLEPSPASARRIRASPSPNTRSRKRRATLDPSDLPTMSDGPAFSPITTTMNTNRRETIGDGDIAELRREYGIEPASSNIPTKRTSKSPLPPQEPGPSKRGRVDGENSVSSKVTPPKSKQVAVDQRDTLFSPPPTNRTNKTPLKSCLSARKAKRSDQTTPNKSVNFGPSQGAEFNLGSPSTSMTPMPARDARAMFPLHEKSPPASEDDDETSLNTSILDEVDGQESSDDDNAVGSRNKHKLSVEPSVSTRSRRRYSLRGVSPLDNQANARRQRRLSAASGSTQQQSPLVAARNRRAFEAAAVAAAVANSTKLAPQKTSFLSGEPDHRARLAYADSSASSDDGEDMELTGDFTNQAAAAAILQSGARDARQNDSPRKSSRIAARQDSLFVDSPLSEATIELGTLRDLVEETYEVENAKTSERRPRADSSDLFDDDDTLQMGTLGELAKESEEGDTTPPKSASDFAQSHDNNLDPIAEGEDEDRRSSSAHSMMSLDSDGESDSEYDKKRKSLVVNLSSKFERFGSGTPKTREVVTTEQTTPSKVPVLSAPSPLIHGSPSPSPVRLPDPMLIEEVLARIKLIDHARETVESADFELLGSTVQRACVADAALSDLRFATSEISSWCGGFADTLTALRREKVSRMFSTDDETTLSRINEMVQSLHGIETLRVRSAYCQWRSRFEKRFCDSLVSCENKLVSDVKALRSMLEIDRSHRDDELRLIREQMERERQMEQLLDGIEEQQNVQRDYLSSVEALEKTCSSLSLEASVLEQQLSSIELASPHADLSDKTESKLRGQVLELEEVLAVRENVGMWKVLSATNVKLSLLSRFDDVFFSVEIQVSVEVTSQGTNFLVVPILTRKTHHKAITQNDPHHDDQVDAVSSIAASILTKESLNQIVTGSQDSGVISTQLATLSVKLNRAYQYLRELRSISTLSAMRIKSRDGEHELWIEFTRFPRMLPDGTMIDGLKFSIGHRLRSLWPFTDFTKRIQVSYGAVTEEKLQQQIDQVTTLGGQEYFARVHRRLHDVFITEV